MSYSNYERMPLRKIVTIIAIKFRYQWCFDAYFMNLFKTLDGGNVGSGGIVDDTARLKSVS